MPRPPGKKSDPDIKRTTIYVREQTHNEVRVALIQQAIRDGNSPTDFSELVQDLLEIWLEHESRPARQ